MINIWSLSVIFGVLSFFFPSLFGSSFNCSSALFVCYIYFIFGRCLACTNAHMHVSRIIIKAPSSSCTPPYKCGFKLLKTRVLCASTFFCFLFFSRGYDDDYTISSRCPARASLYGPQKGNLSSGLLFNNAPQSLEFSQLSSAFREINNAAIKRWTRRWIWCEERRTL